jgi:hypothetical protein
MCVESYVSLSLSSLALISLARARPPEVKAAMRGLGSGGWARIGWGCSKLPASAAYRPAHPAGPPSRHHHPFPLSRGCRCIPKHCCRLAHKRNYNQTDPSRTGSRLSALQSTLSRSVIGEFRPPTQRPESPLTRQQAAITDHTAPLQTTAGAHARTRAHSDALRMDVQFVCRWARLRAVRDVQPPHFAGKRLLVQPHGLARCLQARRIAGREAHQTVPEPRG